MAHFILEIGIEEMPARFLNSLQQEIIDLFNKNLKEKKINFSSVQSYASPRRIIVEIEDLALVQDKEVVEIIGPPLKIAKTTEGGLTKAGEGFAKSQGVRPEDLYEVDTPRGKYIAVKKETGGEKTSQILSQICPQIISSLSFPKKMRWADSFTFGRPIRWLLALLEKEIISFELADLQSSNLTFGHRVMGSGPFTVESSRKFKEILQQQGKVIFDAQERVKIIQEQANKLAAQVGGSIVWKDSLLEEVSFLTEYPKPVLGKFEDKFLDLPEEVLLTSMETHQKSFGVKDKKGKLLPYFLTVINLEPKNLSIVQKGWERVLKARLEDAKFFWQVDLKSSFSIWLEKLNKVTFLEPLGYMGDKVKRLERLASWIGEKLIPENKEDLKRAALLCKCDLVSEMVGEFPELEGIMGGIYARKKGEKEFVATSIYEHYLPKGQKGLPSSKGGSLLSLIDKMDNLVGCFGLKIIPTGASDPYGLRRAALGIIQLILHFQLRISLTELMEEVYRQYQEQGIKFKVSQKELFAFLEEFLGQRLKYFWQDKGYATRIVEATLGAGFDDIYNAFLRLEALKEFSQEEYFEPAVLTFKRVANIIQKQAGTDEFFSEIKEEFLQEKEEKELFSKIKTIGTDLDEALSKENYKYIFGLLLEIKPFIDSFFDKVMVMVEDENLRKNRLTLLQYLTNRLRVVADFAALQV